jgi:4-oxalomesaconate tautomerase
MRGGTSKGLYILAEDLPDTSSARDDLLLRLMGTPDPRQIDGLGGAVPLTSKVAVISRSTRPDADIDYLFLQVGIDKAIVSDRQNCGNLLAGVGPFAAERGLVRTTVPETTVRIRMVNSGSVAVARFPTPRGDVTYAGDTAIAGVPGTAAPIVLEFADTAGSATGHLLPTGNVRDVIEGVDVTCIDNGMPVVVVDAASLGLRGTEQYEDLRADLQLLDRVDRLRIQAGARMGLGDVTHASVPKTTVVAPPADGGMISTRTFTPVQPHTAIGVLGAVSVATAVQLAGAVGHELTASWPLGVTRVDVEHATGHLLVDVDIDQSGEAPVVRHSAAVRTTRKLFDGVAYPRP